ncbi:MAG: sulfatase-like hydrolase/transferase [Bacteroidales bacterium]
MQPSIRAIHSLISTIENYKFKDENPYGFFNQQRAKARVQRLLEVPKDTTTKILNAERPNVVLLLLESWSADVIESITGETGITPNFHELEKDGILFTHLYATGNRSEQAMASIFGGFPSTPLASITHNLDKILKLPSLIRIMNREGYQTSFYFGGQLIYGGIKSYLMANDFDRILREKILMTMCCAGN